MKICTLNRKKTIASMLVTVHNSTGFLPTYCYKTTRGSRHLLPVEFLLIFEISCIWFLYKAQHLITADLVFVSLRNIY